jgi:hypothetical protein
MCDFAYLLQGCMSIPFGRTRNVQLLERPLEGVTNGAGWRCVT